MMLNNLLYDAVDGEGGLNSSTALFPVWREREKRKEEANEYFSCIDLVHSIIIFFLQAINQHDGAAVYFVKTAMPHQNTGAAPDACYLAATTGFPPSSRLRLT